MLGRLWLLILAWSCGPKAAVAILAPRQLTTKRGFLTSELQSVRHSCFASYSGVPGEIAVGVKGKSLERIKFVTLSDCQEACNNNPECKSFLACPYLDNTCFLKDHDLVPGAHLINKSDGDCQNYYKTHCNGCFRIDEEEDAELLVPMPAAIVGSSFTKSQLEHCRGVCAADVDCQNFLACPGREKCYVNVELPPAELNCKRFSKYATRGQVPCLDFPEVGERSHTQTLSRFPEGKCVAIGFHGQYQRHQLREDRGEGCSDYFQSAENIKDMIISPLLREGISVRTYFHTIHRSDCPAKDEMLKFSIDPTRYQFEDQPMARIVDSYISVINLILLDADSVDNIVLIRFDVQYKLPITYLGIDWMVTNLPFKDLPENWFEWNKVSDLFLAFPIGHASAMTEALDQSDRRDGDGGHYMYRPLVDKLGKENVRFIDLGDGYTSDQHIQTTSVFLGIDRSCSSTYFQCENNETTVSSTTTDASSTTGTSSTTTIASSTSTIDFSTTTYASVTTSTDMTGASTTTTAQAATTTSNVSVTTTMAMDDGVHGEEEEEEKTADDDDDYYDVVGDLVVDVSTTYASVTTTTVSDTTSTAGSTTSLITSSKRRGRRRRRRTRRRHKDRRRRTRRKDKDHKGHKGQEFVDK